MILGLENLIKAYSNFESVDVQNDVSLFSSLTTKKQTTKFSSANVKNVKSMLYHSENSKTRRQTV